jgi:hypothetical protein
MPRCKLPECPFSQDGRCLEGRGESCPNLIPDEAVETDDKKTLAESATPEERTPPFSPIEKLYSGLPLELSDAQEFTRGSRAIIVALAGNRDSGKTSLLARLHQLFQEGIMAKCAFAGSRTLPRFEELNWLATIESGASVPLMERSSQRFDNSFLHFKVSPLGEENAAVDILLNDISGETFGEAIATQSVCDRLIGLARCDHLALVLDGAALLTAVLQHDHEAKARNFLQRVIQSGQIGKQTMLHLIISKMDLINHSEQRKEILDAATRLETKFTNEFSDRVGSLRCWRIAARPTDGSLPTGEEIANLFYTWATTTHRYPVPEISNNAITSSARDFWRFEARTRGSHD